MNRLARALLPISLAVSTHCLPATDGIRGRRDALFQRWASQSAALDVKTNLAKRGASDAPAVSAGIPFLSVPAGRFTMGSNAGETYNFPDEIPRQVALNAFLMAKTEVTVAQWNRVVSWAVHSGYDLQQGNTLCDWNEPRYEDCPVFPVSWFDVVKWCNALSEYEGRAPCYFLDAAQSMVYRSGSSNIGNDRVKWESGGYRLPTEAEFEYACRAGSTNSYPWHQNFYPGAWPGEWAFTSDNHADFVSPVGRTIPNDFGLYDLCGNAPEWCWDFLEPYAPGDQLDPRGAGSGGWRVRRGGGVQVQIDMIRCAVRDGLDPGDIYSGLNTGFRPVRRAGRP